MQSPVVTELSICDTPYNFKLGSSDLSPLSAWEPPLFRRGMLPNTATAVCSLRGTAGLAMQRPCLLCRAGGVGSWWGPVRHSSSSRRPLFILQEVQLAHFAHSNSCRGSDTSCTDVILSGNVQVPAQGHPTRRCSPVTCRLQKAQMANDQLIHFKRREITWPHSVKPQLIIRPI